MEISSGKNKTKANMAENSLDRAKESKEAVKLAYNVAFLIFR